MLGGKQLIFGSIFFLVVMFFLLLLLFLLGKPPFLVGLKSSCQNPKMDLKSSCWILKMDLKSSFWAGQNCFPIEKGQKKFAAFGGEFFLDLKSSCWILKMNLKSSCFQKYFPSRKGKKT